MSFSRVGSKACFNSSGSNTEIKTFELLFCQNGIHHDAFHYRFYLPHFFFLSPAFDMSGSGTTGLVSDLILTSPSILDFMSSFLSPDVAPAPEELASPPLPPASSTSMGSALILISLPSSDFMSTLAVPSLLTFLPTPAEDSCCELSPPALPSSMNSFLISSSCLIESSLPLEDLPPPAFCESPLGELGGSSSLSRAAASRAAICDERLLLLLAADGRDEDRDVLMAEVVVVVPAELPPPLPIDVICCCC